MNKTSYFLLLSPGLMGAGWKGWREEAESFVRAPGLSGNSLTGFEGPLFVLSSLLSRNHKKVTVFSDKINFASPLFSASI